MCPLFLARTFFVPRVDRDAVQAEQFALVYHGHFTWEDTEVMSPATRRHQLALLVEQKNKEAEARRQAEAKAQSAAKRSAPPVRRR